MDAVKVLRASQQSELDGMTMQAEPISSTDLMERAASRCYEAMRKYIAAGDVLGIVCGQGNNGGDGLVVARLFHSAGIEVLPVVIDLSDNASEDFKINEQRLAELGVSIKYLSSIDSLEQELHQCTVVIEGLFGTGLSRPLEGEFAKVVQLLNELSAKRWAIDIPAGLFADQANNPEDVIFKAGRTFTFHAPKRSFFARESTPYCGEWQLIDIGLDKASENGLEATEFYLNDAVIAAQLKQREKHGYKHTYGHGLLCAGAPNTMGAAMLSAKSAMRSGVGLLTAVVTDTARHSLNQFVPEVMTISEFPEDTNVFSAFGFGPGWGQGTTQFTVLKNCLQKDPKPNVIDADGIHLLKAMWDKDMLLDLSSSVLTPHKGEFKTLIGKNPKNDFEYWEAQRELAQSQECVVVLKGAYTTIATPEGALFYNNTGHPGMATAGSGDVLTGIILGLLSQGYEPTVAACVGVFLHGKAAELLLGIQSEESMIASDIIEYLGRAYQSLKD